LYPNEFLKIPYEHSWVHYFHQKGFQEQSNQNSFPTLHAFTSRDLLIANMTTPGAYDTCLPAVKLPLAHKYKFTGDNALPLAHKNPIRQ
jgi:hypothetical protein